jgi:flagellar motor protein MotB
MESPPIASNDTACRAQNRRVEILILPRTIQIIEIKDP